MLPLLKNKGALKRAPFFVYIYKKLSNKSVNYGIIIIVGEDEYERVI